MSSLASWLILAKTQSSLRSTGQPERLSLRGRCGVCGKVAVTYWVPKQPSVGHPTDTYRASPLEYFDLLHSPA